MFLLMTTLFIRVPSELYLKKKLKNSVQNNTVLTGFLKQWTLPSNFHKQAFWGETKMCCLICKDVFGEAPLHKAAKVGSMECLSLLVASDAQIE